MSRKYNTRSQGPVDVSETNITHKTTRKKTTYTTKSPDEILRDRIASLPTGRDVW